MQVRFPFVSMWKVSVHWTCQTFTCILCSLFIFTFPPWFTANTKKPCLYFQLRSQTTKRPPPEREQTPARPHSHVWIFKTLPCFPCELSSLTLSVIYKWLLSLIHMGLCEGGFLLSAAFQAPFPVSSSVLSTFTVPPSAKTEQIALSLSLLKARCHFLNPITRRRRRNRSRSEPLETNDLEMKEGKSSKRQAEEEKKGKAFITHGSNAIRNGCSHRSGIVCCIYARVCVFVRMYLCVMAWDNAAVRRDDVTSPAKPSALRLQRGNVVCSDLLWLMADVWTRDGKMNSLLMEQQKNRQMPEQTENNDDERDAYVSSSYS